MTNVINTLLKNTMFCPMKHALKQYQVVNRFPCQARHLYSKVTLGLENFAQQRSRTTNQLANIADKFKTKMIDYTTDDSKNMIFTEDLKNMIHLAEKDDVDLVIRMMNRFNEQNKQLRFGNFVFGPVVMRMFHYLNRPDEALQCFNSPKLEGFFDQLMSYQLLMDLLYENKKYQEVLDVFEKVQAKQIEGTKYPRNIVVLTLAGCYKLNTQESLKFALKLWGNLQEVGHLPMRRAATFCGGLALNQGQPEATLEIVSSTRNQNYTTVRNLKVAALASIGRLEDVIPLLKGILNQEVAAKQTFNKDILEKVKELIERQGNTELKEEFKRIEQYFIEHGHLSDMTLDEQLCTEIAPPPLMSNRDQQNRPEIRFNRFQRTNDRRQFTGNDRNRPGLSELQ